MELADLIAQMEVERDAMRNRQRKATAEITLIIDMATKEGRANLTEAEDARVTELFGQREAAQADEAGVNHKLAKAQRVLDEEKQVTRRAAGRHTPGANPPGAGDARPAAGAGVGRIDGTGHARWVRKHDGRDAALGRGQRFADHPIAAEEIARAAGRDEHVIGMHGGIGHLVRSMSTTSGSAVVPQIWASDVIDRARNLAAVTQAGATVVPMDSLQLNVGRLTADPTAAFHTEGAAIVASDPTFDTVSLVAKTLVAGPVIGSWEWFQDVTPGGGADQLITDALAKVVALAIDQACLLGGVVAGAEVGAVGNNLLPTGTGLPTPPNPKGVLATLLASAPSSVLGNATNGTSQTAATFYKEVIDTIWMPRDFNEAPNAMIWPSRLARIYAEAVNTLNDPMRVPADVDAIEKYVSNQVPSGMTQGTGTTMSDLFVGNWEQLLIGMRLDLQIQTLVEQYAPNGQIGIIAVARMDCAPARPRAFSAYRYLKGF